MVLLVLPHLPLARCRPTLCSLYSLRCSWRASRLEGARRTLPNSGRVLSACTGFEKQAAMAAGAPPLLLPAEKVAELRQAVHCQVSRMNVKEEIQRCLADSGDRYQNLRISESDCDTHLSLSLSLSLSGPRMRRRCCSGWRAEELWRESWSLSNLLGREQRRKRRL